MPASKELLAAYDDAMAVMSRPCRFLEWKLYGGGKDPKQWGPFGTSADRRTAWRKIKGARWIYVFRDFARVGSAAVWVDELYLDKDGTISATPMDKARVGDSHKALERDKRPQPIPVGDAISFPRRINGVAMQYYFFASRIRLPAFAIDEIGPNISACVAPVTFEENDANLAGEENGALLVPVLDPITVAVHLHACYVAAADDLVHYTTVNADQSDAKNKQAARRQKKHLLAQLIAAIVHPKVDTNNQLVHRLKNVGGDLEDFLKDYDRQIQHRVAWRDRWASLLANWLRGKTMDILARAHRFDHVADFHKFLIPYCLCLTRANESAEGRKLLDEQYAQKDHWLHRYVLPPETPAADVFQVIRKSGGATFEVLKEYGGRKIVEPAKYMSMRVELTLNRLAGEVIADLKPTKVAIVDAGAEFTRGTTPIQVMELELRVKDAKLEPKWEGAATKVLAVVEAINIVWALFSVADAMKGDDRQAKVLAALNLMGSGLDFSTSVMQLFKSSARKVALLGFVSGVIDAALAIVDAAKAYDKGDMGGMVGSAVIAIGSMTGMASASAVLLGVSGTGLGIIALALVALGYSIKLFFGDNDTDFHKLVQHCEWGIKAGTGTRRYDWAPKPPQDWPGDYDTQLKAAVSVLCGFKFEAADHADLRAAKLVTTWIPQGAKLALTYHEEWESPTPSLTVTDTITFRESGASPSQSRLTIKPQGKTAYVVRPVKRPDEKTLAATGARLAAPDGFKTIWVEAQLTFELGAEKFTIPDSKRKTELWREAQGHVVAA